jgi:hypothetical protein
MLLLCHGAWRVVPRTFSPLPPRDAPPQHAATLLEERTVAQPLRDAAAMPAPPLSLKPLKARHVMFVRRLSDGSHMPAMFEKSGEKAAAVPLRQRSRRFTPPPA